MFRWDCKLYYSLIFCCGRTPKEFHLVEFIGVWAEKYMRSIFIPFRGRPIQQGKQLLRAEAQRGQPQPKTRFEQKQTKETKSEGTCRMSRNWVTALRFLRWLL